MSVTLKGIISFTKPDLSKALCPITSRFSGSDMLVKLVVKAKASFPIILIELGNVTSTSGIPLNAFAGICSFQANLTLLFEPTGPAVVSKEHPLKQFVPKVFNDSLKVICSRDAQLLNAWSSILLTFAK